MTKHFDYLIIGGGLAGLQLALNFGRDRFFEQKTFAVIDPSEKTTNDKTWCFWEKGETQWDKIILKSWKHGKFISSKKNIALEMGPYTYKMLRSLDFYDYVKLQLKDAPNITFIKDEITEIDKASMVAFGKNNSYSTLHIFDSRITVDYLNQPKYTNIFQHFKGWTIETSKPHFDTSSFTMMDFRLKFKDSTSFTYVLPISKTKAIIEFTFFTPFLTEEAIYNEYLEKYIQEILKIEHYTIAETEMGVIPMTTFPFHNQNSANITKIGTAGSWVKGSTGYSYKHTEKKVHQLIENIKKGKNPSSGLINKKARFYDAIFLDVLFRNNEMGEQIFTKFYSKNPPEQFFKYLDEETTLQEDLKIMLSLYHPEFVKSFFREVF